MRSRGKFGQTNFAMEFSSDESHTQAIYTGSTVGIKDPLPSYELEAKSGLVGMLIGSDGYHPEPYFLIKFLRSRPRHASTILSRTLFSLTPVHRPHIESGPTQTTTGAGLPLVVLRSRT